MIKKAFHGCFCKYSMAVLVGVLIATQSMGAKGTKRVEQVTDKVCCDVVRKVLPQMTSLQVIDSVWVKAVDAQGKVIGYLLNSTQYGVDNIGRNGPVPTLIVLDSSKKILRVEIGRSSESPAYLSKIQRVGFCNRWNGMTLQSAKSQRVDAVTGATLTSSAVAANVRLMANMAEKSQPD